MCMSLFAFVMQEVNAQIINHQQKHFYEEQLEIFASSKYITGMGLFSQCTDFLAFVLNASVHGHNPVILFTSFLWFCLMNFFFFFFAAPPQGKPPLPLPQQCSVEWLVWAKRSWTGVHQEEFDSKVGGKGHFQSSTRLQKHTDDEVSQRCPLAQKCMSPWQMTFSSFNSGCLMFQMLRCKQKYRQRTKMQSEYRVKSTRLYQTYKGKANFSHVNLTTPFLDFCAHCTSVDLHMCSLALTV